MYDFVRHIYKLWVIFEQHCTYSIMRYFLTLILILSFTTNFYSQDSNLNFIRLSYSHSAISESKIDIFINKDSPNKNHFFVSVITSESQKKYSIENKKMLELKEAIIKISPSDIIKENRMCLDGSDTEISFSNSVVGNTEVKYSVHCLSSQDDKTAWKDFLNVVNMILDIAKMKFTDLK